MALIVPQVTEQQSQDHLDWFRKWTGLLDMEFTGLVEDLIPDRETRGQAEAVTVGQHRFVRSEAGVAGTGRGQGLSSGELVVTSTDSCLALSMGYIICH